MNTPPDVFKLRGQLGITTVHNYVGNLNGFSYRVPIALLPFVWNVGFPFSYMKQAASKVWKIKIDKSYKSKVSIVVPPYNESEVIHLKLENL